MKEYAGKESGPGGKADPMVCERISRAEQAISHLEPAWSEQLCFLDGEQYVEQHAVTGRLERLETREGGRGKPRHRIRRTRNRFTPAVIREVALCSARTPIYECDPLNGDALVTGEARLEEKCLLSVHQQLGIKQVAVRTMTYAKTNGAGFTWAYFNPALNGGEGEIEIDVLSQAEVLWDGGDFEKSRWFCVRKAKPVDQVTGHPDYVGPRPLEPDAQSASHETRKGNEARDLVYVYNYLERPSRDHPRGRWLQLVQGQVVRKPEDYPWIDADGSIVDEPVIQMLADFDPAHRARPRGMGADLVEVQRDINRIVSQIITHKDLAMSPQMLAPVGALRQKITTEPGAVYEYRPIAGLKPEWRTVPEIPASLFRSLDQALADWEEISGQSALPAGLESGSAVQAVNERDQERRALFVANLSAWYCRLGERLLSLMRVHYSQERLMIVRGMFGAESIVGFRGQKLRPVRVRVAEGSITPRTKEAQRALIVQLIDRGLVDPRKAIYALNAGTTDALIDAYELNVHKQRREIKQLIEMGQLRGAGVPMVDEEADDHPVHAEVIKMWMLTEDFEMQPPLVQEAARTHAEWHRVAAEVQQMRDMERTSSQAERLGMVNAGAPQNAGAKPMPSQPSVKTSAEGAQAVSG
jgi:hypothetical protein